jgi:hypothetical protein
MFIWSNIIIETAFLLIGLFLVWFIDKNRFFKK